MSKHLPLDVRVAIEADNEAIVRDESLCIKCGQCKTVCQEKISIHGPIPGLPYADVRRRTEKPLRRSSRCRTPTCPDGNREHPA